MEKSCSSETLKGIVLAAVWGTEHRGTRSQAWTLIRTLLETFKQNKMAPCPRVGAEEVEGGGCWLLTEAEGGADQVS